MSPGTGPLLQVRDLVVEYRTRGGRVTALRGVSLDVAPGETVGLVGESGSGKTTLGRAVLGLVPASSGTIMFGGQDITRARGARRRALGARIQAVFQDPYGSLNPALKISASLAESLRARGRTSAAQASARVADMLRQTGLPETAANRHPGAFSGGQRQRLAIARALMPAPDLVICDEATSALDLSVQAQILNLLRDLQREHALSYLFIGHDLDVVRFVSHRIIVLYRGMVMEEGPAEDIARNPTHPYTKLLTGSGHALTARSTAGPVRGEAAQEHCPFAPRCHLATEVCLNQAPRPVLINRSLSACHHLEG